MATETETVMETAMETATATGELVEDCSKAVHFVYFVEADAVYDEAQRDAIETTAYAFQAYWYDTLGVTFYLADPIVEVIHAAHESQWYVDTPDMNPRRSSLVSTRQHQDRGLPDARLRRLRS